jgi:hypothetical protein
LPLSVEKQPDFSAETPGEPLPDTIDASDNDQAAEEPPSIFRRFEDPNHVVDAYSLSIEACHGRGQLGLLARTLSCHFVETAKLEGAP